MSCSGGNSQLTGGRSRRRKAMKGGNFYGAAVDPQLGSAGLAYPAVVNAGANAATGAILPESGAMPGGRRRRGRKGTRKTGKKTLRRKGARKGARRGKTMRGGASYAGSANSGAGFGGLGYGGLPVYSGYAANVSGAGNSHTQTAGVWNA
jgi:hypothetical protein